MGVQFSGNILVQTNGGPLPISAGGTGQTTSPTAINALLPTQTGQSGKILTTNGTNVSWTSGAVTPGGSDTNIQFNDAGTFGGNAFFTVNKSTGALTSTSTFKNIGLIISDSDALYRTLKYQTSGSNRWLAQADNTTEAGSNSGSDFEFVRVADNGATTNQVYTVSRATGVFDFKAAPTVNGSAISSSTAASALTGTTLASNVVSSSLTSVGTITTGVWNGTAIANANLANSDVANLSGTNTGDNAANTTYANDYRAANFVAGTNYLAPTGNGSGLTNITGANVTGTVANATTATSATTAGTVTTAAQPTITSVGTLTSLSVTGVSTSSAVSVSDVGLLFSYTLTTSTTAAGQVVGTSAIATYRSVKYNISITSGSSYQYTEVTAIHDGTNVYITENCTLMTGSSLATFTADISGGNMRLLTTPANAVTAYKVVSVHIAV